MPFSVALAVLSDDKPFSGSVIRLRAAWSLSIRLFSPFQARWITSKLFLFKSAITRLYVGALPVVIDIVVIDIVVIDIVVINIVVINIGA